tara:strand:- start:1074 stop:1181 length:108 start_codon:yes stop_codon:yes gene_type:complete
MGYLKAANYQLKEFYPVIHTENREATLCHKKNNKK